MSISKEINLIIRTLKTCNQHIELELLLEQLLSPKEIKEIYNRLAAAEMLLEERPYTSIVRDTGASSATVAKVAKLLQQRNSALKHIFYTLYGKEKYTKMRKEKTSSYTGFSF